MTSLKQVSCRSICKLQLATILNKKSYNYADAMDMYGVTIAFSPPNGPYKIGDAIACSCFVNPTPPEPVTYHWRAPQLYGYFSTNGQNTSFAPSEYFDFHFIWFYCSVRFSNGSLVAEGKRLIQVHGEANAIAS